MSMSYEDFICDSLDLVPEEPCYIDSPNYEESGIIEQQIFDHLSYEEKELEHIQMIIAHEEEKRFIINTRTNKIHKYACNHRPSKNQLLIDFLDKSCSPCSYCEPYTEEDECQTLG